MLRVTTQFLAFVGFLLAAFVATGAQEVSSPDSFSPYKYVIAGRVLDDQGASVDGVALHIGRRVAYTDSSGRFQVRASKPGTYPFSVAREELVRAGIYQILSAPSEVHAEAEDRATDVQVVVRRVPPPQAKLLPVASR